MPIELVFFLCACFYAGVLLWTLRVNGPSSLLMWTHQSWVRDGVVLAVAAFGPGARRALSPYLDYVMAMTLHMSLGYWLMDRWGLDNPMSIRFVRMVIVHSTGPLTVLSVMRHTCHQGERVSMTPLRFLVMVCWPLSGTAYHWIYKRHRYAVVRSHTALFVLSLAALLFIESVAAVVGFARWLVVDAC